MTCGWCCPVSSGMCSAYSRTTRARESSQEASASAMAEQESALLGVLQSSIERMKGLQVGGPEAIHSLAASTLSPKLPLDDRNLLSNQSDACRPPYLSQLA